MALTKFVQLFAGFSKFGIIFSSTIFDLYFLQKLRTMKFRLIKKVFLPILFLISFAACNSNEKTDTRDIQLLSDSTAYHNSISSDSAKIKNESPVPATTIHSNAAASHSSSTSEKVSKSSTSSNSGTVSKSATSSSGTVSKSGTSSNSGTASNSGSSTSQGTQKKGWSKGAQGAVIGGATGAVGGAIISKHKGAGAAIGAAVGAAGGYIIGHEKDKKDGRVKK